MINIRKSVFETNSSSTHSLILCMKDEYIAWKKGEFFLNQNYRKEFKESGDFITKETAIELIRNTGYYDNIDFDTISDDELYQIFADEEIYTVDSFEMANEYSEWFEGTYTTPAGENVVAFGTFGYDG